MAKYNEMVKMFMITVTLLLLIGCSNIGYDERVGFCIDNQMEYRSEVSGGWTCKINDIEYVSVKLKAKGCQDVVLQ